MHNGSAEEKERLHPSEYLASYVVHPRLYEWPEFVLFRYPINGTMEIVHDQPAYAYLTAAAFLFFCFTCVFMRARLSATNRLIRTWQNAQGKRSSGQPQLCKRLTVIGLAATLQTPSLLPRRVGQEPCVGGTAANFPNFKSCPYPEGDHSCCTYGCAGFEQDLVEEIRKQGGIICSAGAVLRLISLRLYLA